MDIDSPIARYVEQLLGNSHVPGQVIIDEYIGRFRTHQMICIDDLR